MLKAVVIKSFSGARDGEFYPRQLSIGDEIEGDLARVAIAAGLAKPEKPPRRSSAQIATESLV